MLRDSAESARRKLTLPAVAGCRGAAMSRHHWYAFGSWDSALMVCNCRAFCSKSGMETDSGHGRISSTSHSRNAP